MAYLVSGIFIGFILGSIVVMLITLEMNTKGGRNDTGQKENL